MKRTTSVTLTFLDVYKRLEAVDKILPTVPLALCRALRYAYKATKDLRTTLEISFASTTTSRQLRGASKQISEK